jgi:CheY-like chemotaxis protein
MRVLIVEDNAFNAFCLRRLLESAVASISVTIVHNSKAALSQVNHHAPDMVVIDGDLEASNDGTQCNGPELAHILLQKYPDLPLIAWSNSDSMRVVFMHVFKHHDKPINEYNTWNKLISVEHISKTWNHYFSEFINRPNAPYFAQLSNCG